MTGKHLCARHTPLHKANRRAAVAVSKPYARGKLAILGLGRQTCARC
jgi:hypothetical protein